MVDNQGSEEVFQKNWMIILCGTARLAHARYSCFSVIINLIY